MLYHYLFMQYASHFLITYIPYSIIMHYKDKTIWITGASSGIGEALARLFAKDGAKLILTARNIEALKNVMEECLSFTKFCQILPADLTNPVLVEGLAIKAISIYGNVDLMIHSAGVSQRSFGYETSMVVYRSLMEINYFAPVALTSQLLNHFVKRGQGHIVAISSVAGLMGFPLRTGYAASKHAINGYFESLQVEKSIPGLVITIVSPGRINTSISLNALTGKGDTYGKMDKGQLNGIPVDKCAMIIREAILQKKKHLFIGKPERMLWWLWWLYPPLYRRIAGKKGLP